MKRKVIMALTVVFALSLAITVFALNQNNVSPKTSADCCAKKDSCPMKDKQAKSDKASCCDKDDCCCKGGSCPMKMSGEKTSEGKECCCKDGVCPMKKDAEKQTASVDMTNVTVVSDGENCCQPGADCCKGGSCCKGKHS